MNFIRRIQAENTIDKTPLDPTNCPELERLHDKMVLMAQS
jgi:hypothetical protein